VRIKNQKDFFAGLVHAGAGVAFAVGATNYSIGSSASMGPGYFPLALGVLLAVIGAIVMLRALTLETADGNPVGKWAFRPLACIVAANLAFGILLDGMPSLGVPAMGMVAAIYALVLLAALAWPRFRWIEALILATVLAAGSWLALVWGLKLPWQVWPGFVTG
jgi:hypothetical protein